MTSNLAGKVQFNTLKAAEVVIDAVRNLFLSDEIDLTLREIRHTQNETLMLN